MCQEANPIWWDGFEYVNLQRDLSNKTGCQSHDEELVWEP